jgi:hypothetical protein
MLPNKIRKDNFEKEKMVFITKKMEHLDDEHEEKDFIEDIHNYPKYNDENEDDTGIQVLCDKYYEYPGINKLSKHHLNVESIFSKIYICIYQVNTLGKCPILQFFMKKEKDEDELFTFPYFLHDGFVDPFVRCQEIIEIMLLSYGKFGISEYVGFLQEEKDYYLFFDCSKYEIDIHNLYRENEVWLLTMDEILNNKEVCTFSVDPNTRDFFLRNPDFIYLQNSEKDNYEIPEIVYIGTTDLKSGFVSTFGVGQSDYKSLFGPHYYFYTYQEAVKMSIVKCKNTSIKPEQPLTIMNWLKPETDNKCAIIRFALFLGRTKVIDNFPNKTHDDSRTTLEMLKEDPTCSTKEYREIINYLRISDRDSLWINEYDSIFLSENVLLDDETLRCHSTMYVVKNYEQQLALSCHFLDISVLDEPWRNDRIYVVK